MSVQKALWKFLTVSSRLLLMIMKLLMLLITLVSKTAFPYMCIYPKVCTRKFDSFLSR